MAGPSVELLQKIPLFTGLKPRELEQLSGSFKERTFNAGETVATEGQEGAGFFVIESGEALVTVLSPRGVPTPLAATRLLPPDSLMAALDSATFQGLVAANPLESKYGAAVDRESAHEMITARLQQAHAAAAAAAAQAAAGQAPASTGAPAGSSGTAGGFGSMTPAEQEREIRRQAREMAAEQKERELQRRAAERQARADARARDRMVETGVRTAGRVITSRAGQDLIRSVFGTLFGSKGR